MRKLDFKGNIKDAKGNVIAGIAETLALVLQNDNKGNGVKYFGWAVELVTKQELIVDEADCNTLKGFVESNDSLFAMSKYYILKCLDNFKEIKE